ncbi:hypothetical protein K0M31_020310, partial [Melipona bicolor]
DPERLASNGVDIGYLDPTPSTPMTPISLPPSSQDFYMHLLSACCTPPTPNVVSNIVAQV